MEVLAVLIPVKNNASIVRRALDSVTNQTAFLSGKYKYEIFLVDNDSSDNLKEVISGYKNITYLFCKTPGIVAALNTGLFHIMSLPHIKYIARIDADDIWTEKKIEIQFSYMLENPNIDICGTAIRFIKGNLYQEWHYGEKHSQMMADMSVGQNPIAHPSVIYKKDIFYKCGGYDETFRYNEDLDLWMRASKHFTFHNMQDVLLHYNLEQKSDAYHKEQDDNARKLHLRNLIINDRLSINRE